MTRAPAVAPARVLLAVAQSLANGVSVRPVSTWTSDGRVTDAVAANGVVYLRHWSGGHDRGLDRGTIR